MENEVKLEENDKTNASMLNEIVRNKRKKEKMNVIQ